MPSQASKAPPTPITMEDITIFLLMSKGLWRVSVKGIPIGDVKHAPIGTADMDDVRALLISKGYELRHA